MHLFKESRLANSVLILILYINIIIRSNTLILQKQKEIMSCFFSTYRFLSFYEVVKFWKLTVLGNEREVKKVKSKNVKDKFLKHIRNI